jgi:NADH-quinone oxidoreductase subunit N
VNDRIQDALINWVPLVLPEIILVAAACVLFLGGTFRPQRDLWGAVALLSLAVAALAAWFVRRDLPPDYPGDAHLYAAPVVLDDLALVVKGLAFVGGAILVLFSWDEVPDGQAAEYHACLLVIVAGTGLAGMANELVTLFLALELVSIPTYVLLYLPRHDNAAQEAAMKYFLLSIFSSALMLFGFSYLYGLGGTTNLPGLARALAGAESGALPGTALVALVLVVAGLGFRIAAVPFHFYAPDVYQGTTAGAAALLAYIPKVAGFVALVRVLGYAPQLGLLEALDQARTRVFPGLLLGPQVSTLFWILAAVTMTLGNVLALLQDNLKRLLAYSSVAHAGYMLIGLAVAPYLRGEDAPGGVEAILFYLAAYGAMTIGVFAVISYLSTRQRPIETVDDLAGLSRSHPGVALVMMLFLFSLIGIPATGGFAGKFLLFWGAMSVPTEEQARLFRILALIGVLNAAIGAWYYLRIVAVMYLRNPLRPAEGRRRWPALAAIGICAVLTIALGVPPLLQKMVGTAREAVPQLRAGR